MQWFCMNCNIPSSQIHPQCPLGMQQVGKGSIYSQSAGRPSGAVYSLPQRPSSRVLWAVKVARPPKAQIISQESRARPISPKRGTLCYFKSGPTLNQAHKVITLTWASQNARDVQPTIKAICLLFKLNRWQVRVFELLLLSLKCAKRARARAHANAG